MPDHTYKTPDAGTHFLVSGGGKGITAENAVALAEAFQSQFILIGRSTVLKSEPAWSEGITDGQALKSAAVEYYRDLGKKTSPKEIGREVSQVLSSREISQTLDRITRAGGTAEYLQADITKSDELKDQLEGKLSSINGLLHGAGALADKLIDEKSEEDFDLVYGVKIGGLMNILELLPPEQLDYIILFSSVAGFYGNAGQADYSLSNEILNKLAFHIKDTHPSCQVLSINWGPWDGGMVTPQLKRILTRKNVALITPELGTSTLVDLMTRQKEKPQYVVGTPLPFPAVEHDPQLKTYRISRALELERNPFLADHVIGGNAVLPTVCAVAWIANVCCALYPGFQFHTMDDYRVFKGIVFEEEAPSEYLLEINEIEKTIQKLVFEGRISSSDQTGKQRFHYQARIGLTNTGLERPQLDRVNLSEADGLSGSSLYGSKTLFHGPSFQGVQKVLNMSPEGLTTECLLPPFSPEHLGQFPIKSFNPLLADVHLQSLLIWAHHNLGSIGLPLQIKGAVQHEMPPLGITTYATMRVQTTTSHKLVADVISHDHQGSIYTEVHGAEITLNQKLYELFQNNQLEKELV